MKPPIAPPRSYWDDSSFFRRPDVVLVGAGLLGLWTAHALKKQAPHLSVVILEKDTSPTGASTRNAGFACFGSLTEMLADEAKMGTEKMLALLAMRFRGIEKIKNTLDPAAIGYEACGGYEQLDALQAERLADQKDLQRLNQLVRGALGIRDTYALASVPAANLGLRQHLPIVRNAHEGVLNSGWLVAALGQLVQDMGVAIRYGFALADWQETDSGVAFVSEKGQEWTAGHLAFCTNGYLHQILPQLKTQPARGQIIVTEPIEGLPWKGSFHAAAGFYYWRHLDNRILLGGGRHLAMAAETTTDLSGSDFMRDHLLAFLHQHLLVPPNIGIERHWSGIMGFSDNKEPLLQALGPHSSAALACNGMGVALTPIMGESLAAQIMAAI